MSEDLQRKVIDEIISSELSYLKQLDTLENYFSKPIYEKGFLPSHIYGVIFNQLSTIYQMNKKLLEEVSNKKEENVGQAFIRLGPFLKAYSTYANNFEKGLSFLQEWQCRNEDFKSFVCAAESRPEVQSKLTALLIAPIQRIPRYRLLLEELLKFSDSACDYYKDIKDALELVSDVATHVDRSVDDAHILQRLLILQKALRNQQPSIIAPGRKLLKEGILNKVSRKGKGSQERLFFLFTDMIMYTKFPTHLMSTTSKTDLTHTLEYDLRPNSLECCCILPLRYCRVMTVLGSDEHGITFRLQCSDEDLLLYSKSSVEGRRWISAIKDSAQQALQKRKTLRKASSKRTAIRRPAFQKFKYSDDENSSRSPNAEDLKCKSPLAGNFASEKLKSRICHIKDCLTPPKRWLSPKKNTFKRALSDTPNMVNVGNSRSPANEEVSRRSSFNPNKAGSSYGIGGIGYPIKPTGGSPHGISPLVTCSSDYVSPIKMKSEQNIKSDFRKCYHLRNSVTLRNSAKAGFLMVTPSSPSGALKNFKNEARKKRPITDLKLESTILANKKNR